jgi:hypothetical protein
MKPQSSADPSQMITSLQGRARVHGTTIISVPHQHVMTDLCVEETDTAQRAATQKMFKVRLANNHGHRMSASFLVQQRYAWRGYDVGVIPGIQPNRITLSAFDYDEVIATISVGLDSILGLFVDKLYSAEVDQIRASKQRKVCEFTKLAIDGSVRSKTVLAALFHIAYIYARRINRCTDLLVEVNPRHVLFYRHMLGFSDCGPERLDPRVRAPAVLLRLRLAYAEQQIAKMGGRIELALKKRSLYPYFFSQREEIGIEKRLRELG